MTESPLSLSVPAELVDAIAERVVDLLAERLPGTAPRTSPWMTVAEAAEYLRWPRERLYKLTAAGAIPHRKHDGRVLLHRDELDEWLDGYREGPAPLRPARAPREAA